MTRNFFSLLLLLLTHTFLNAQKDCSHDYTGLIPLTDLGDDSYRGFSGGLYPGGSNERPVEYLTDCINKVQNITTLNADGNPDEDGRIVMLAIGASNPGAEFNKFSYITDYFEPRNDKLSLVNGCGSYVGIEEMNYAGADYWNYVISILETNGFTPEQVQVIWLEEENIEVGDTTWPSAPQALVSDFHLLLETIKILFPNTQMCYVTARAYAGYTDSSTMDLNNGLKFPRDYYNGWAIKWLIENVINQEPGYAYDGPAAEIPMVTWATYHWTDGSVPRIDGLFLDCEADVAPDGLHLSGDGETKMGLLMQEYFTTDTTAKYWFFDEGFNGIFTNKRSEGVMQLYPNPISNNELHFKSDIFQLNEEINIHIYSADGKFVLQEQNNYSAAFTLSLPQLESGLYFISINSETAVSNGSFVISR